MPAKPLRIATINTNGIRAAFRKGMGAWLDARDVDILAIQEVRASTEDLQELLGDEWDIAARPRDGEGPRRSRDREPAPRRPSTGSSSAPTTSTAPAAGSRPTTRSTARSSRSSAPTCTPARPDTPKQVEKYTLPRRDGGAAARAAEAQRATPSSSATSTSGTARSTSATGRATSSAPASCLRSAPTSTASSAPRATPTTTRARGLGWVDVGRKWAGEVDGPYTWWSWRGQAFDNDTGWRIDYQLATPALAATRDGLRGRPRGGLRRAMVRSHACGRRLRRLTTTPHTSHRLRRY